MPNEKDNEIEIQVSPDKVSLRGQGEEIGRVTNALADMLSPFSEAGGAIGDIVRVYRQQNAIRALSKAKKLADTLNVKLKPIAPKFLVQWVEGASLEEPGNDDLTDLWASLLVNTNEGVRPVHLFFKRLLTEMNGRHKQFLEWLCDYSVDNRFDYDSIKISHTKWNRFFNKREELLKFNIDDNSQFVEISNQLNSPGLKIHRFKLDEVGDFWIPKATVFDINRTDVSEYVDEHVYSFMEMSGIISNVSNSRKSKFAKDGIDGNAYLEIHAWHLTSLGKEFVQVCTTHASNCP